MTIAFSMIVPAFNEAHFLPVCLASLKAALHEQNSTGEIIVVNNNSSDETRDIAIAAGVRVVDESINQISRARNAGAREARGEFLFFVDADTTVDAELVAIALRKLQQQEVCGGGALIALDRKHRGAEACVALWNRFASIANYAAGCFFFCRADAFKDVGGFSLEVYASEEIWLANALKRWGKVNRMPFEILAQPVVTSARKLEWMSRWQIVKQIVVISVFPFALRSRRFCRAWYDRPESNFDPFNE